MSDGPDDRRAGSPPPEGRDAFGDVEDDDAYDASDDEPEEEGAP